MIDLKQFSALENLVGSACRELLLISLKYFLNCLLMFRFKTNFSIFRTRTKGSWILYLHAAEGTESTIIDNNIGYIITIGIL